MSAEVYQNMEKERAFIYIDNRAKGIINFLRHRSQSLTLDKMIEEVRDSIPTADKEAS